MRNRIRRKFVLTLAFVTLAATLTLGGCSDTSSSGSGVASGSGADMGEAKVGSKGFTENLICSELYALALEEAGYTVDRAFDVASSVAHEAIVAGQIDVYP